MNRNAHPTFKANLPRLYDINIMYGVANDT